MVQFGILPYSIKCFIIYSERDKRKMGKKSKKKKKKNDIILWMYFFMFAIWNVYALCYLSCTALSKPWCVVLRSSLWTPSLCNMFSNLLHVVTPCYKTLAYPVLTSTVYYHCWMSRTKDCLGDYFPHCTPDEKIFWNQKSYNPL